MEKRALYELADTLGMKLDIQGGVINGGMMQALSIAGLPYSVTPKIISSWLPEKGNQVAVLCSVVGSLVIYIEVDKGITLSILDLYAKPKMFGLFEDAKVTSLAEARDLIRPAVRKTFSRPSSAGHFKEVPHEAQGVDIV